MPAPTIPVHPAARIFPPMSGEEFTALVADIKAHGQREPIVLHDGAILDGRNRYRACLQLGIEPRTMVWDHDGTPEAYVVSKNLHRRHLNANQRHLIGARLCTTNNGDNRFTVVGVDKTTPNKTTSNQAANLLGVNRAGIAAARSVLRRGTAEEIAAIERGEESAITLSKQIRTGISPEERQRRRDARRPKPVPVPDKKPKPSPRQTINADIWRRLRDALLGLTGLPLPADVVRIVRHQDKGGLIDDRLARSLQWLEDFSHDWNDHRNRERKTNASPRQDAEDERRPQAVAAK